MWNNNYQLLSASEYLIAVMPVNDQELSLAPAGSNNRPLNSAGSQAPNGTWGGPNGRSLNPAQSPNPTLAGSNRRPLHLAGQATTQTFSIPMMAIPSGVPLPRITVSQASGFQSSNPTGAGSNGRPLNPAGTQAPNGTSGGPNGRSLNAAGAQTPNPTSAGPNGRSSTAAGAQSPNPILAGSNPRPLHPGQAISHTFGMPMMAIPAPGGMPLPLITVSQASDYAPVGPFGRPLYQYTEQTTFRTPIYQNRSFPYQYPLFPPGGFSYPQHYIYPHQCQHETYTFPCQFSTSLYPDDPYENSRYSGPTPFFRYGGESDEYDGFPTLHQSFQVGEYVEADSPTIEEIQPSTPSAVEPPEDVNSSFDCAFCRFRAENESLFRSHNNSCKAPEKKKGKNEKKPPNAK